MPVTLETIRIETKLKKHTMLDILIIRFHSIFIFDLLFFNVIKLAMAQLEQFRVAVEYRLHMWGHAGV